MRNECHNDSHSRLWRVRRRTARRLLKPPSIHYLKYEDFVPVQIAVLTVVQHILDRANIQHNGATSKLRSPTTAESCLVDAENLGNQIRLSVERPQRADSLDPSTKDRRYFAMQSDRSLLIQLD